MNVLIVGAGEVGFHLARVLAGQDHDVVVLDPDPERLARIEEQIDVTTLHGDGTHLDVLRKANAAECDLLVAAANRDNVNLVACRLAKAMGARRGVVRTSDLEAIIGRRALYRDLFDVDLLLSTQMLTTSRILERVHQHQNLMVEEFLGGKVELRRVIVESGSPAAGQSLTDLKLSSQALVVALFRGGEIMVPRGETVIDGGDQLLVVAASDCMPQTQQRFSKVNENPGSVMVAGGGETAVAVCRALLNYPVQLKVIERSKERCTALAQMLPKAVVILGAATETALLQEENIDHADHFLALTGDDEVNVVASLLARDLGARGIVTLVHRPDMLALCERMGLEATSPRLIAAERILEYVDSDFISNIATVADGGAHMFERVVKPDSPFAGKTLAEIVLPAGALVVAVQRGDDTWVPAGRDTIEAGDLLVLFSTQEVLDGVINALEPA